MGAAAIPQDRLEQSKADFAHWEARSPSARRRGRCLRKAQIGFVNLPQQVPCALRERAASLTFFSRTSWTADFFENLLSVRRGSTHNVLMQAHLRNYAQPWVYI